MDEEITSIFSFSDIGRNGSSYGNKSTLNIPRKISKSKKKMQKHGKTKAKLTRRKKEKEGLKKEKKDWADDIIDMVTVPAPKRYINDDKGVVSKEESMERLIYLLLLASSLLVLIATVFLVQMDFNNPELEQGKIGNPRVPHVFIIYQDGLHIDFSTDEVISPSKNFEIKLRHSVPSYRPCGIYIQQMNGTTGYLAYANDNRIYVFSTDGKKDMTYIDIKTGVHRTITNTAFTSNFDSEIMFGSSVRVGNKFLMAGDRLKWCYYEISWSTKLFIWNEKREILQQRKKFPVSRYDNACYASYNRFVCSKNTL